MKAILVDDDALSLDLLVNLCEQSPQIDIRGTFSDSKEALAFAKENPVWWSSRPTSRQEFRSRRNSFMPRQHRGLPVRKRVVATAIMLPTDVFFIEARPASC